MKFPYLGFAPSDEAKSRAEVIRPIVPLILRGSRGTFRRFGLVDTGSDYTLVPTWIADVIGVDLPPAATSLITGIEGTAIETRTAPVEMELRSRSQSYRWRGLAHFADQDYVLLGNEGFLEYFVATFDLAGRTFELTANSRLRR